VAVVPVAKRRRKEDRRSEILEAARSVFAVKPFEQASVKEIAERAGCVEGTIYTYFRNKRDLFDAVLADFYDRLIQDIEPRFAAIRGTRDRLCYLIARQMRISLEDPGVGSMIRRESRTESQYFGSKLHALNRRYSSFLQRTIADGIERGDLRADLDPMMARDLVFGGIDHWVWNNVGRQRQIDPVKAAERMVAMLLDGWGGSRDEESIDSLSRRLGRLEERINGGRQK
jgi:TetR/AcrR family transcriptional regulator, fatty acid metabolism regulator protein